ncbi:MAG: acyltransferase family protein [Novosphingobium sp.]
MSSISATAGKPAHHNAFGFLRLVFASLVIVSHVPQFIDGNPLREPLYALTGTVGFGGLSVDGFFLISGYLVVASFCSQPTVAAYLARRIARIVPGFVVTCLFCIFVVAPLSGASWDGIAGSWRGLIATTLTLHEPAIPGTFAGTYYHSTNGSMWTIAHEFRAYLLVMVLGLMGLYRWRIAVPVLAAAGLLGYEVVAGFIDAPLLRSVIGALLPMGDLSNALRLTGIFLVGSSFYLYRESIPLRPLFALFAAVLLVPLLFVAPLAEPAFAVLGAYIIFTIGFGVTRGPLARINNANDISYGVYLYAWPVGKLLLWFWPAMPVWLCITVNWMIACLIGWASWHLIEKPAMAIFSRKRTPAT